MRLVELIPHRPYSGDYNILVRQAELIEGERDMGTPEITRLI